jgi:hypothetical protein
MRKWFGAAVLLIVGSWLASPSAHASLVEALDLAALVERSDEVVLARVVSAESRFNDRGRIVTDVTMQVEETQKGARAPGAMIVVRHLGGAVGDLGMRIAGEPTFTVGETVLLFGRRAVNLDVLRPVGMSQGALRIEERDGERWVRSLPGDAALVHGKSGTLQRATAAVEQPRKLSDVLAEVRALVATPKK